MLRLALSWTSESTGCSGNLWCRRGIHKSHLFWEVIEGWSHVPLALAHPSPCWGGNSAVLHANSRDLQHLAQELSELSGQVLHMQFCTSNSKTCSLCVEFIGLYWIQGNIQSNAAIMNTTHNRRSNYNHGLELQRL